MPAAVKSASVCRASDSTSRTANVNTTTSKSATTLEKAMATRSERDRSRDRGGWRWSPVGAAMASYSTEGGCRVRRTSDERRSRREASQRHPSRHRCPSPSSGCSRASDARARLGLLARGRRGAPRGPARRRSRQQRGGRVAPHRRRASSSRSRSTPSSAWSGVACIAAAPIAVVLVGLGLLVAFTLLLLVMGPAAVRQAQRFGNELPETVTEMYSFPIIGPRLERANAADRVEQWAEELPAHIDTDTITNLTSALVSGAATLFTVAVVAFIVLLDGEFLVARVRRLVPAAPQTTGRLDRPHVLQGAGEVLRRIAPRRRPRGRLHPRSRVDLARAARSARRGVDDGHRPHPSGRRVPRRSGLRAARRSPPAR